MFQTTRPCREDSAASQLMNKRINSIADVTYYKTKSPAYRDLLMYVDLMIEKIRGTSNKILNRKYKIIGQPFEECSQFLLKLERLCDETDLNLSKGSATLRFGHIAYRDWFDKMKIECKRFISVIASGMDEQLQEELYIYLSESFGNRMRIDYGTGHELNFIVFTIGLSYLVNKDHKLTSLTSESLKSYVDDHGFDLHALFAHHYLKICRRLQTKFRLEPAGSRGVYNMDDFQFLPFLFGAAQLSGVKYISTSNFYQPDQVEMFKDDFVFFGALEFILNNKRGPFSEHSYTLWGFTNLGSWDNITRRIQAKFIDDVLSPFPVNQHLLFGKYILKWDEET